MNLVTIWSRSLIFTLFIAACSTHALGNDEIFPSQPAAEKAITWKDGYFVINGKPTFITSGEMHYARIPRELWRDRIWRAKELGFNCVQMYVFWNATEGKEGVWDWSDNLDLDAWLTMIQDAGMYAIVRVGPYSCAEWDDGGFPAWLMVKPGMTLRDSGADFDKYAFRHLDEVEKIVAKHQINHGGNVIMAQLENEHPHGWGTDDKDPYLHHLVDQARANGLEIPVFLSGQHHGGDPSGWKPYTVGSSPWFTTEFWTGWIGKYGDMDPGMLAEKIAGTWKIIAFGGAGYDYYVVHGGTNFGYSGFSHDATYDYSAPVGESGNFNNFYAPAKRAAYFVQSFSDLFTGSHNDPDLAKADAPDVRVTSRTNPAGGSFILLDRFGKKQKSGGPEIAPAAGAYTSEAAAVPGATSTHVTIGSLTLPHQGAFQVESLEPRTVLLNLPWTAKASFESICTNVLLKHALGMTDYWVVYGAPGDIGEVTLQPKDGAAKTFSFTYPTDESVKEVDLDSGDGRQAKFLIMNKARTEKVWLAHDKIYIGPSFVQEDGSVEFPAGGGKATVISAAGQSEISQPAVTAPAVPALATWSWRDAATERSGDIDKTWLQSQGPQPTAAYDSFQNRYAWYRTTLHADAAGPLSLYLSRNPATKAVFWNGQLVPHWQDLPAVAGDNTLAVLVKTEPRSTFYLKTGPIGDAASRGLFGGISADKQGTLVSLTWKTWQASGSPGSAEQVAAPGYNDSVWVTAPEMNKGSRSWLRTTFTLTPEQVDSFIEAPGLQKADATVWLNGQRVPSLKDDLSKVLVAGTNTILLEPHNDYPELKDMTLTLWHNSPLAHATWYFHGGLHGLDETPVIGRVTNWASFLSAPWQTGDPSTPGLPTLWKTTFDWHATSDVRQTLGLTTEGLKTGHVWLNGHNLGECPQKVPLFVPECWLKEGANDLVVFDLAGNKPDKMQFTPYETFAVKAVK